MFTWWVDLPILRPLPTVSLVGNRWTVGVRFGYPRRWWATVEAGWLKGAGPYAGVHAHSFERGRCFSWNPLDGLIRRRFEPRDAGAL